MSGVSGFVYEMELSDGTLVKVPQTVYLLPDDFDVGALPSQTKYGTAQEQFDFLNGIFNDDFWYTPIIYVGSNLTDDQMNELKIIFAGATRPPKEWGTGGSLYATAKDGSRIDLNSKVTIASKETYVGQNKVSSQRTYPGSVFFSHGGLPSMDFFAIPQSYIKGGKIILPECKTYGSSYALPCYRWKLYIYFNSSGKIDAIQYTTENTGLQNNLDEYIVPIGKAPCLISKEAYEFFNGYVAPVLSNDPYDPGGVSGPGGGDGSFKDENVPVGIPSLPSFSATDSGFVTLWNPSTAQLKNLASYMWSDSFDLNGWKKLFADPMDAILGLSLVPVAVPAAGTENLKVGNIDTGVAITRAATQWVSVDCGTVTLNKYWGAYLDQEPHTKLDLFLPFIGVHPVSADEVMGKAVHVVYHVDILSGACMAYVEVDGSVLYSFTGQCSIQLPVTSADFSNQIAGALQIAGQIGTMVATGGMTAPTSIPGLASTALNMVKPSIERSGSLSGNAGFMGMKTPYFIITRPRQAVPERQNEFLGYPTFITKLLGDVSGYTEIENIHLENVPCTDSELSEIETLLKAGVIF